MRLEINSSDRSDSEGRRNGKEDVKKGRSQPNPISNLFRRSFNESESDPTRLGVTRELMNHKRLEEESSYGGVEERLTNIEQGQKKILEILNSFRTPVEES
jgi:hypothetical protein